MDKKLIDAKISLARIINSGICHSIESNCDLFNHLNKSYYIICDDLLDKVPQLKEAIGKMKKDHPLADNVRFCDTSHTNDVEFYEERRIGGCCGSIDEQLVVDSRVYMFGCNYGH